MIKIKDLLNKIFNGDCLEGMKRIPDKSIDMILCDLPYGTTNCKWDTIINFDLLWSHYERIIKDNGAIILFGSEPFSSHLRLSNINRYRYDWIWEKNKPSGFLNSKRQPMKSHEDICVFYKKQPVYNPQGLIEIEHKITIKNKTKTQQRISGGKIDGKEFISSFTNYPRTVLRFENEIKVIHPTQKPLSLFEYLIKTYTNEGEIVLDNCMGSGTTAIACMNTNRNYIGFEMDEEYYEKSLERIKNHSL